MIEGIKYDGRPVESVFQPEDAEGNKMHQVAITYGDDKEPKREIMSSEEWEAMQQKVDDEHARGFYLQDATYPMRKRIMTEFEKHNPRYVELGKIFNSLNDDLVKQLKDGILNLVFGKEDWFSELTIKDTIRVTKEHGKELAHGELGEREQALVEFLAEKEFPISLLAQTVGRIMHQIDIYQNNAIEAAMGIPYANIRLDDLVQYMERKIGERKAKEDETKTEA